MTENEPGADAAQREMVTTSGGTPLPTGVDRRGTRRSKRTHSVFRAIKAQHSGERTRMNVIADWLTNLAGTTGFLFSMFWLSQAGCFGIRQSSASRASIHFLMAFSR